MRPVFFVLLLANLVFFVWSQGYVGASDENREPQRLEQQLNADKLRIVRAGEPAPAKKEVPACRVVDGLNPENAEILRLALVASGVEVKVIPQPATTVHLVLIPDLANKVLADKKLAELARFGVEGAKSMALDSGRHEIVLGSFPNEAEAREFLQGLGKRGIKSARIDARDSPLQKVRVETRGPAETLLQQLPKLIAAYADAAIGECVQ